MIIGVPKEIKNREFRVGLTEAGVQALSQQGHTLLVESGAGLGSHITNDQYESVGAKIVASAKELYTQADMIIKVKEPLAPEYALLREDQILYTYLHLAAEPDLARVLCERQVKSVAYETIEDKFGGLPLLQPMSEVAGRMATQVGAIYLQKNFGGKGVLLSGVTGVDRAHVCIIGGGVVGLGAAKMAVGLGAKVTILDTNLDRLEFLDNLFGTQIQTLYSNQYNIARLVKNSDLVIGAVLIKGAKAPCLVSKEMVQSMSEGSVIVDVAVDQGGCIETCQPTSHESPTYVVDGIVHYCVPNMPGVVSRTSTYALTNATFNYASVLAKYGVEKALQKRPQLEKGINTYKGYITYEPVAQALNLEYRPLHTLLS